MKSYPKYLILIYLLLTISCARDKPSKLAFVSNRDGNWEIYVMNPDGSGVINVSRNLDVPDTGPQWSPDGSLLAFSSDAGLLIADQSGDIVGEFTPERHLANGPSWSSDSEFVAFHSTIDGNFEVYIMRYNGTDLTRLTYHPSSDESCPNWSPDGNYIAYASHPKRGAGFDLHVMRSDGSDATNSLGTWAGTAAVCPLIDWSPDGKHIAAVNGNLTVFDKDQSNQDLIIAECAVGYPDWSPDGNRIVFAVDECTNNLGKGEIYVINSDGTNLVRLTNNSYVDYNPVWSPDGRKIAFVSSRDGNREIYIMNDDGSQQENLSQNDGDDNWPVWQP